MSRNHRSGSAQAGSASVLIATAPLDCTPLKVLFLGAWEQCHIHWNGKRPVPCLGDGKCDARIHRSGTQWRGFCPAGYWASSLCRYVPCVMEITEHAEKTMRGRELAGEVWKFTRVKLDKGRQKVFAEVIDSLPIPSIPAAFDVRPIVENAYHSHAMLWDLPPLFAPELVLPMMELPAPPGERGVVLSAEDAQAAAKVDAEKRRALIDAGRATLQLQPRGSGAKK